MPKKKKHLLYQSRQRKEKVLVLRVGMLRSVLLRVLSTALLVALLVFVVHGVKEMTATLVGVKFAEVLTDVFADRIFPSAGEL